MVGQFWCYHVFLDLKTSSILYFLCITMRLLNHLQVKKDLFSDFLFYECLVLMFGFFFSFSFIDIFLNIPEIFF